MKRFLATISVVFIVMAVGFTKSTGINPTAKGNLKEKPNYLPFEGRYTGVAMDGGEAACSLPFHGIYIREFPTRGFFFTLYSWQTAFLP